MATDAFVGVQPDANGKKVQTFEVYVNGQLVEAQAVVLVNPDTGAPTLELTRARRAAEETQLIDADALFTATRSRHGERMAFTDRRGGSGQRGSIR